MDNHNTTVERIKPNTKKLWKVFWILLGLTALEFIIAFKIDADYYKWTKINLFIILTIVKAYYIVGIFMHLKDETKAFIWTMVLPLMFVLWLIGALLIEGDYFGVERFKEIVKWINL